MTDLFSLVVDTGAYKIIKGDKDANRLSHAYLLITPDGANLEGYLKIFAKLIACKDGSPCNSCRTCTLIDNKTHADTQWFPKEKDSVVVEDISALIEDSYVKPLEGDKKLFVINHAETMNGPSQNKLLKTLEEPPKNVYILIGATAEFPLLPTLKSRVKKLELPLFDGDKLYNALKNDYPDSERLKEAIACSDGTVGNAVALYGDENLSEVLSLVSDMIVNMQSSKDVLEYSVKISNLKCEFSVFLSALKLTLRDMLVGITGRVDLVNNKKIYQNTKQAKGYSEGAILHALGVVDDAFRRKKFNANAVMLIDWLLFQILEGKYKWQKL